MAAGCGALVNGLDLVVLGGGQVDFWAGALIGRVGVSERAAAGLPDAALHPVLAGQRQTDGRGQVSVQLIV